MCGSVRRNSVCRLQVDEVDLEDPSEDTVVQVRAFNVPEAANLLDVLWLTVLYPQCEKLIGQSSRQLKKCDSVQEQSGFLCKRSGAFARSAGIISHIPRLLCHMKCFRLSYPLQAQQTSASNTSRTIRATSPLRPGSFSSCSSGPK